MKKKYENIAPFNGGYKKKIYGIVVADEFKSSPLKSIYVVEK